MQCALVCGVRREVVCGVRCVECGPGGLWWCAVCGAWCRWCVECDVWCVVFSVWCAVYSALVCGVWCCVVCGGMWLCAVCSVLRAMCDVQCVVDVVVVRGEW